MRLRFDKDPARHKLALLSRGAEAENEDQQHWSQEQPVRARRSRVRRARIAVKWGCLPSCVHYAGFSPSFAKLAMCQHLKGCDGEPAIQRVSKIWNVKNRNRQVR